MFYILSKIVGLLINPLIWILALLIIALLAKNKNLKRKLYLSAIVVTLLFSNSFLFNEVLYKWENKGVSYEELKPCYDYGIVLSGMLWYDSETQRTNFSNSADRIWQAVHLYHEGKIEKILITGGAASFFEKDTIESVLLKNFLIDIGIPEEHVITEERARNTYENAIFTAELLKTETYNNLLLITSASHMRRSKKCFKKAGLVCDVYPVDHYSGARRYNFEHLFVPNTQTLFNWNAFIHEIFGMISYKLAGYI
ncbi:MAG: YdcF family protein [Salinivirgaceae bacterium]|jgi:uncharacterized SAM-binding protein YcdF (DUF218 family)|nr:YdcF family protein [Salinivirgaceae bacterium]